VLLDPAWQQSLVIPSVGCCLLALAAILVGYSFPVLIAETIATSHLLLNTLFVNCYHHHHHHHHHHVMHGR